MTYLARAGMKVLIKFEKWGNNVVKLSAVSYWFKTNS